MEEAPTQFDLSTVCTSSNGSPLQGSNITPLSDGSNPDSDGALSGSNMTWTFTAPAEPQQTLVVLFFTVSDSEPNTSLRVEVWVTITPAPRPVCTDPTVSSNAGAAVSGKIACTSPPGKPMTFSKGPVYGKGTFAIAANGLWTYKPLSAPPLGSSSRTDPITVYVTDGQYTTRVLLRIVVYPADASLFSTAPWSTRLAAVMPRGVTTYVSCYGACTVASVLRLGRKVVATPGTGQFTPRVMPPGFVGGPNFPDLNDGGVLISARFSKAGKGLIAATKGTRIRLTQTVTVRRPSGTTTRSRSVLLTRP